MSAYKIISKKTIGTSREDFDSNPKRIGLLVQNLSANTIYFMNYRSDDSNNSIEIDDEYIDEVGASAGFSLKASAAASEVRIEEIIKV